MGYSSFAEALDWFDIYTKKGDKNAFYFYLLWNYFLMQISAQNHNVIYDLWNDSYWFWGFSSIGIST